MLAWLTGQVFVAALFGLGMGVGAALATLADFYEVSARGIHAAFCRLDRLVELYLEYPGV